MLGSQYFCSSEILDDRILIYPNCSYSKTRNMGYTCLLLSPHSYSMYYFPTKLWGVNKQVITVSFPQTSWLIPGKVFRQICHNSNGGRLCQILLNKLSFYSTVTWKEFCIVQVQVRNTYIMYVFENTNDSTAVSKNTGNMQIWTHSSWILAGRSIL